MNHLLLRTFLGFAFLMLVMALALFLPAGSLGYWQGWAYLAVFAGCTLLITLYLIRNDRELLSRRVQAGPVAETRRSQQVIQGLASLCFLALFIVPGLDDRFGWSRVAPGVSILADGLVALGFYVVFLTFRENSFTSATIETSGGQQVVTRGPYRLVRHPMYAGALFMMLFTPVALGSWVAVPLAAPLALVIVVRLLDEEKFLSANLQGYAAYREKVRYRLLPFVW